MRSPPVVDYTIATGLGVQPAFSSISSAAEYSATLQAQHVMGLGGAVFL